MRTEETQTIEELEVGPNDAWHPIEGEAVRRLRQGVLPSGAADDIVEDAREILSKCLGPSEPSAVRTGLVVGRVQSGKTSSFTTVAAFAKDNGFDLVIVLTGLSKHLFGQSMNRLRKDLGISNEGGSPAWSFFTTEALEGYKGGVPRAPHPETDALRKGIALRAHTHGFEEDKPPLLVVSLKNKDHLDRLLLALDGVDLRHVKALVIDDEAHQGSLDYSSNPRQATAIYSRIVSVRQLLPHHTFLQYTATPQAPLLVRLSDILSPDFCKVIRPGASYTGGETFFETDAARLLVNIPDGDLQDVQDRRVPESLTRALWLYLVGVCQNLATPPSDRRTAHLAMMVHPSERTAPQSDFGVWLKTALRDIGFAVGPNGDPTTLALCRERFDEAIVALRGTFSDLLDSETLWGRLAFAVDKIGEPVVMNAAGGRTPAVDYDREKYNILVGGVALDVGYTVEGLSVTYMSRLQRTGNTDSIQQRARWFGYKEPYIGLCRVFLPPVSRATFASVVDHDRELMKSLESHTGPLDEWKRAFFIDAGLRPTRSNVVRYDLVRGKYENGWFSQTAPQEPAPIHVRNAKVVDRFVGRNAFDSNTGFVGNTAKQSHKVCDRIALGELLDELLVPFAMEDADNGRNYMGLLLQLRRILDMSPEARRRFGVRDTDAAVYLMGAGSGRWTPIQRGSGRLHGQAPPEGKQGYVGDRNIRSREDRLSVQIYLVEGRADPLDGMPALAVWVPPAWGKRWMSGVED